jgi:hypothetical protein
MPNLVADVARVLQSKNGKITVDKWVIWLYN